MRGVKLRVHRTAGLQIDRVDHVLNGRIRRQSVEHDPVREASAVSDDEIHLVGACAGCEPELVLCDGIGGHNRERHASLLSGNDEAQAVIVRVKVVAQVLADADRNSSERRVNVRDQVRDGSVAR